MKDSAKEDKKTKKSPQSNKHEQKEDGNLKTQLQRLQAEFENYRKRTDEERSGLKALYISGLVEKLAPILDHFELALQHECSDKNYAMGVEMIFNSLKQALESEGVHEIEVLGKPFDPAVAEVAAIASDQSKTENEVIEVKSKGYKINDKIIRRARVVVNKPEEEKHASNKENKADESR